MKKKNSSSISNTKIALVFFAFLALIAGISLIFKIIAVAAASRFDDSKRFTLAIANNRNIEVMSLSSDPKNVTVFQLNNLMPPAEAGRFLKIPIDGFISFDLLDLNQKVDSLFAKAIFSYKNLKTNLTIIDLLKLAMSARTIPESAINVRKVGDISGSISEMNLSYLVSDILIEKDHQTIQIVNATDVSGLGNRLARLITNMGGNVIIVATENSHQKKSAILYIDKKTYTIERLQKVLGFEAIRKADNAISDITIIIGEDRLNSLPF